MENETVEIKDPEALLKAYEQAKKDLVALRDKNKTLESQVETLSSDTGADTWKARALKAETRLALKDQGVKDVDRLMKFVDTEGLDFDDEGNVTGLTEKLDGLKNDLPEIFDPKRRAGGKADIFADNAVEKSKSTTEAQVDALFS